MSLSTGYEQEPSPSVAGTAPVSFPVCLNDEPKSRLASKSHSILTMYFLARDVANCHAQKVA